MTRLRFKRGSLVHATHDLVKTLCGRKASGGILEPDAIVTCRRCYEATEFN